MYEFLYPKSLSNISSILNFNLEYYPIYNSLDFNDFNFKEKKETYNLILLSNLRDELDQIYLGSIYLEIGSLASFNKILFFGEKNIPNILYNFLKSFKDHILLNHINIANGFFFKDSFYDIFPVLSILDAQLEFRDIYNVKKTFYFNINSIRRSDFLLKRTKLIFTKIKIPIEKNLNKNFYYRFSLPIRYKQERALDEILKYENYVSIFFLFNIKEKVINYFIFEVFMGDYKFLLQNNKYFLLSKSLPLSLKEIEEFLAILENNFFNKNINKLKIQKKNFVIIKNFCLSVFTKIGS